MANGVPAWQALFLSSLSPGAVFRFLERRLGRDPEERGQLDALGLLLSDAVPPGAWRVLSADGAGAGPWMQGVGAALSEAFPPEVVLVWREPGGIPPEPVWGFIAWAGGTETERGDTAAERPRGLIARLAGITPETPPLRWARERGLPTDRIPALAQRLPIVEYATVARLDEKGLLTEETPRLYRFRFAG